MKTLLLTTVAILLTTVIFAQSPQAFKYQAVIRNNQGKVLVNQIVSLRVSILQNDPLGSPVYIETHQIATNEYGIANLSIGSGTVIAGVFADIAWGVTTHFVKTELDITGNQNYEFIGTSQLLSVPYALYAEKAGNANDDMDKDPINEIQIISKTDSTISLSKNGGSIIDSDKQTLSLNNNELTISNGNTIQIPPDNDADTLNEIQNLSLNGNELTISKGNTITFTGAVDLDADPTNELQIITISNDTIYLTNGGFLKLPKEVDADSTNELQVLDYSNDTLYLSKSNFVVLPHNFDNDSTNEIQTLTQDSNIVTLSHNGGQININDADNDTLNEIQQLTYNNDTLSITNGNSIYLPIFNNLAFPDGPFIEDVIDLDSIYNTPYTVPNGFNLYINYGSGFLLNGIEVKMPNMNYFYNPVIIGEGSVLSDDNQGANIYRGYLFKKRITPLILNYSGISNNNFTVPDNKYFVILSYGNQYYTFNPNIEIGNNFPTILNENETLISTCNNQYGRLTIWGYLIDKN
ncbi:MAG: hypothetical protein A2046_11330 [Bacteroidetes bacterium GWA2_30_7]|nr:MAG: hypothetical protein A2046_11330 [Bacteroidetes bacterium GWA2_30_7]